MVTVRTSVFDQLRHTEPRQRYLRSLLESARPEAIPRNFKVTGFCRRQYWKEVGFHLVLEDARGTRSVTRVLLSDLQLNHKISLQSGILKNLVVLTYGYVEEA